MGARVRRFSLAVILAVWGGGLCWQYLVQRPAPPTLAAVGHMLQGVIVLAFFMLASVAAGTPFVRSLLGAAATQAFPLETTLYAFGLGGASLSLLIFVTANLGLLCPAAVVALLAAAGFLAIFTDLAPAWRDARSRLSPTVLAAVTPFLALALMCALAEPASTDALRYHLSLPAAYLQQHSLHPVPNNFYSFWPMATEMLYAAGLSTFGETAPALIHLGFAIAAALMLQCMSTRGAVPAALFLSIPAVAINAGFPFVDLALTFYVVAAFQAMRRFLETRAPGWAVLAGLLCSAAVATKYTGLWAVIAVGVLLLLKVRAVTRGVIAFVLATLIFAWPWMMRNISYTGNPVYPYFQTIWGKPSGDTYRADRQGYELRHIEGEAGGGWTRYVNLPQYYLLKQPFLDSTIGPALAILLPCALLVISPCVDVLLFCFIYSVFWTSFSPQARLLFPVLALLTLPLAAGLEEMKRRWAVPGRILSAAVCVVVAINFFHLLFFYRVTFDPLARLLGAETREQYLTRLLPEYPVLAAANSLPKDATVLTLGEMSSFYIKKRTFPESMFDTPLAVSIARGCTSAAQLDAKLRIMGITHVLLNSNGLEGPAWIPGRYADWSSPGEKQAFFDLLRDDCEQLAYANGVALYRIKD